MPGHLYAKANPKSSTGRLDVFTRVITDANQRFDDIRPGYRGRLYLEIFPRSFTIKVCHGLSLNQLRLFSGTGTLDDSGLSQLYRTEPLLYGDDNQPLPLSDVHVDGGLFMGVETARRDGDIIGYKARKNSDIIDLAQVGLYEPSDFWEPIRCVSQRPLILEPEEFYILASKERVRVRHYAAELMAYDAAQANCGPIMPASSTLASAMAAARAEVPRPFWKCGRTTCRFSLRTDNSSASCAWSAPPKRRKLRMARGCVTLPRPSLELSKQFRPWL